MQLDIAESDKKPGLHPVPIFHTFQKSGGGGAQCAPPLVEIGLTSGLFYEVAFTFFAMISDKINARPWTKDIRVHGLSVKLGQNIVG